MYLSPETSTEAEAAAGCELLRVSDDVYLEFSTLDGDAS